MTKNRFNLIDEPWIPVADVGTVSLMQVFSEASYKSLGGNPVEKIALTKLLLAIAQAACTPSDDEDWARMGTQGMAEKCLAYLKKSHDFFWLYGDRPFLQVPGVVTAKEQPFGAVLPEVATGNTTVLTQFHLEKKLSDAERTLLILVLMGFALGGKKTDNSVVLTRGYKGKTNAKGNPSSGKAGSAIGFLGYMHNFLQGDCLIATIWLNLLTVDQIKRVKIFPVGLGVAPWEAMPTGEADSAAEALRQSYMGRLIPLGRFCLLGETGLRYSEGIFHEGHKAGIFDMSIAVNFSEKKPKALWINPEKRPWRQLTALLSFMESTRTGGFDCYQIRFGLSRARERISVIGIWSGGLRVTSNAGEQFLTGTDDFVESLIILRSEWLGEMWYERLKIEMNELEEVAKNIYGATMRYFKTQNMEGQKQAAQVSNLFWQLCERKFQHLIDDCNTSNKARGLRGAFAGLANKSYDRLCPRDTARQLDAWAKNRPNLSKYLKNVSGEPS